jgi:hypothetical protein
MCVQTNMCADASCVAMHCAMQQAAAQTCFNTAQMSNMTCRTALGGCLGAYPIQCN